MKRKKGKRVIRDHEDKAARILSFVPVYVRGVRTDLIKIPLRSKIIGVPDGLREVGHTLVHVDEFDELRI